jgi:hypothetical protein
MTKSTMTKSMTQGNAVATVEGVTQGEGMALSYTLSDYLKEASFHADGDPSQESYQSPENYQLVSHQMAVNEAAPDFFIPSLDLISAFCTVALLCYLLYREYISERVSLSGRAWLGSDSIIKRSLLNQEPYFRGACFRGGSLW